MAQSDFAIRLNALLKEKGINRQKLSDVTGIPYHRISDWMRRENSLPNGPDLDALADYFGKLPSFILYGDPSGQDIDYLERLMRRVRSLPPDRFREVENYVSFLLEQVAQEEKSNPKPSDDKDAVSEQF